jgi:hypothetical protein
LALQAQAPASEIGIGQQMQQALVVTCSQEFERPPYFLVSYVYAEFALFVELPVWSIFGLFLQAHLSLQGPMVSNSTCRCCSR